MPATGFQQFVNTQPAPGVAGDFASVNRYASVASPSGGFVAGPLGLAVAAFAWGNPATGQATNYWQANSGLGFVHREMQGIITNFLGTNVVSIAPGFMCTLMNQGDFWANFPGGATVGQKVFADPVTGAATSGAAGSGVSGTMTASVSNTGLMTVSAITGTPLAVNQGVNVTGLPPGSYISALGTGTGGTGTYQLANPNGTPYTVVSSTTINYQGAIETSFWNASNVKTAASVAASIATSGIMTVTSIGTGVLEPGQFLSGNTVPANTVIQSQLTGTTGGTGTYQTNTSVAVNSTTIAAVAGQLGKISSWGA